MILQLHYTILRTYLSIWARFSLSFFPTKYVVIQITKITAIAEQSTAKHSLTKILEFK